MNDRDILEKLSELWDDYKNYLQKKYPVFDGMEWEFTCSHHKKIDSVLKKSKKVDCDECENFNECENYGCLHCENEDGNCDMFKQNKVF